MKLKAQIGIFGLGVMGANYARNLANNKIRTVVYNRTRKVTKSFTKKFTSDYMCGSFSLEDFIKKIGRPRKIILTVSAGNAVDAVIASLLPLLNKGDILLDFGNSFYKDTSKRHKFLRDKGILFVGCGISGGEKGALEGPCLMPGGEKPAFKEIKTVLEKTAAKDFKGKPCVTYIGPESSGHFVKMVHNGIEYALIQLIAEAYDILNNSYSLPAPAIADIFKILNKGKLNSFLFETTEQVLRKIDRLTGKPLVDLILDEAGQKGTGNWTAAESLKRAIATPVIAEAVYSRIISGEKLSKKNLLGIQNLKLFKKAPPLKEFKDTLKKAFMAANVICFAQGYEMIARASKEEKWNINPAEISRIWQGGCIIRSKLLEDFYDDFASSPSLHLFSGKKTSKLMEENIGALIKAVSIFAQNGIPAPCFASSLNYFFASTRKRGPANIIQALRDSFGSHNYKRMDKKGTFHTEWDKI